MSELALQSASPPSTPRVLGPTKHRIRPSDVWTTFAVAWMIGVRDIKAKYKQSVLGPLWLLIAPLGMLAAVTIAFAGVTDVQTSGIPYLLFALTGLTVWTFVQLSLQMGSQAVVANSQLVRRSPLPRLPLMTGSMVGNMPPFLVMLTITVVGTALFHHLPVQALLLPVLVGWLLLLTFGVTLLISALAARFRDAISAMPLFIQAGLFVTPVGYGFEGAPSNIHKFLTANPVSGIIEAWRWALLDLPDPEVTAIVVSLGWTLAFIVVGWRVFGRMEVDFADYV